MGKKSYVVAWYEIDRAYGGSEEGGWWFDTGELVRTFHVTPDFDKAVSIAWRANRLMDRLQRNMRSVGSMAYSGGRYQAEVHENAAPAYYPERRPHYE